VPPMCLLAFQHGVYLLSPLSVPLRCLPSVSCRCLTEQVPPRCLPSVSLLFSMGCASCVPSQCLSGAFQVHVWSLQYCRIVALENSSRGRQTWGHSLASAFASSGNVCWNTSWCEGCFEGAQAVKQGKDGKQSARGLRPLMPVSFFWFPPLLHFSCSYQFHLICLCMHCWVFLNDFRVLLPSAIFPKRVAEV